MRDFIAIDFETANPQRVSACALGYARVANGQVIEANGYLMKPIGGHAAFQSKIHGITEDHTFDKPDFGQLYPDIKYIFNHTLVAHSLFDQQVLKALAEHFRLKLEFMYFDTSAFARERLPDLKNHKLKTLVKHFRLPKFRHHDAKEDAVACAHICLHLHGTENFEDSRPANAALELKSLIDGILADDEVSYREAYELLYWLEDHGEITSNFRTTLYEPLTKMLNDNQLDALEAAFLRKLLLSVQETID